MMRDVILSTPSYDPDGYLSLHVEETTRGLQDWERRATVIPTLDGGVVVDNLGVFDAGRVIDLTVFVDDDIAGLLSIIGKAYPLLQLATEEGLFSVVPMNLGRIGNVLTVRLQVKERLA